MYLDFETSSDGFIYYINIHLNYDKLMGDVTHTSLENNGAHIGTLSFAKKRGSNNAEIISISIVGNTPLTPIISALKNVKIKGLSDDINYISAVLTNLIVSLAN